jgi:hypothetical protein
MAVGECGRRLFEFGIGLHSMTQGQHRFIIQFQLSSKFSGSLAFTDATHQQDDLHGRLLTALKYCASVEIVNRPALLATMNFQFAGLGLSKLSCLFQTFLTLGTFESLWMKMLAYPLHAVFIV